MITLMSVPSHLIGDITEPLRTTCFLTAVASANPQAQTQCQHIKGRFGDNVLKKAGYLNEASQHHKIVATTIYRLVSYNKQTMFVNFRLRSQAKVTFGYLCVI